MWHLNLFSMTRVNLNNNDDELMFYVPFNITCQDNVSGWVIMKGSVQ